MTDKMPKEWEERFVDILLNIQREHKAYWVQTKHIMNEMFGEPLTIKDLNRSKMRITRLANRLQQQGKIITTYQRRRIGKSTGYSLIRYYHYAKDVEFYSVRNRDGKDTQVKN